MFVERLKTNFGVNEPIFTNEILKTFDEYSRAYVFRLIDEAKNDNSLVNFDTGVYFLPMKTTFGNSTILAEDVVYKKYISYKDEVYGLYSGLFLQNMFNVTTQMPNTIEIISNNESSRKRKTTIGGRTIILRKSRVKINKKNVYAYTILQLFSEISDIKDINDEVRKTVKKYMIENRVTEKDLILLAKYFPSQTLKKIIYGGILYEIT
ncbi:MAG: hypothetical protein GX931_02290 [Acholeplasmataceae bacterium]|jgi:hypothetical protein|nr:hypothetical protein [Acholeplasmataceae bacterium]